MIRGSSRAVDWTIYLILSLIAFFSIAPILNTLAISFSGKIPAMAGQVFFWPVEFNLSAYESIMRDRNFFISFGVSIERVLLGGAINFVITVLMAYPLSRTAKLFPGRNVYMWFVIFCMLFNGGLIPWYMTIYSLGLLDSIWALVLPTAVPVFNVILLMNFFKGIPKELEEAANMDGAGPWKTLSVIFVPISLPALATVTLFSIVGHWNAFFDGMILMQHKEHWPLQTYIQQLIISVNSIMNTTDPEEIKRLTNMSSQLLNSAKVMVSMVPILLIYPFLQKYFVSGIVLGAVKE
ncbi:carbohydrate ABC transporter permease [Cohnella ginsengisoli]|uniref:Carbohydrate ABC transporter permease n=2 Tax=Cohnella TaxID=329857 RepID=A0A9X4L0G9_9BACL|nr:MULTISPECIES: carbohydrate ABC transporter permease [Cohnella]MDG0795090.1 carbohydrate ABC transporter permease [Cohnella ginsengisoli]MDG0811267.1 carbohydrate ABC transporter permease [Cohnella rhizosphaerae]